MEKISLEDESEINITSINQFEPLVKINLDEYLSLGYVIGVGNTTVFWSWV